MKDNNSLGWTIFILVIIGIGGYVLLNNIQVTQKVVNTGQFDECNGRGPSITILVDRDQSVSGFLWWECMDVCRNQNYKHDNLAYCNHNKELVCECRVTAYDQYIIPLFSR
jgi:hypothetical protein